MNFGIDICRRNYIFRHSYKGIRKMSCGQEKLKNKIAKFGSQLVLALSSVNLDRLNKEYGDVDESMESLFIEDKILPEIRNLEFALKMLTTHYVDSIKNNHGTRYDNVSKLKNILLSVSKLMEFLQEAKEKSGRTDNDEIDKQIKTLEYVKAKIETLKETHPKEFDLISPQLSEDERLLADFMRKRPGEGRSVTIRINHK